MSLNSLKSADQCETNVIETYDERKQISVSEIFNEFLYLGANSFGIYRKQNLQLKNMIVNDKRYITLQSFNTIVSFSEHLPGSTCTQVIVCISAVKTSSILGTFLGFLGYIIPGLVLSLIISSMVFYLNIYVEENNQSPLLIISTREHFHFYLQVIITGLNQGSLAILFINGFDFSTKFSNSSYHLFLIFTSAIVYYFFESFSSMITIMIISGIISVMKPDQDYIIGIENFTVNLKDIPFIGTQCLIAFLLVYIIILSFELYFHFFSINFFLIERFFRMGTIFIGGGASILPFILTEFSLQQFIREIDVLSAFSIISLLPGPVFNIACIIGTFINGPIAGLSSIILFFPGVLIILWALPYANQFKQMYSFQRFLSGVNCSGIGFIFTACFKLWIVSCVYSPYSNWIVGSINFIITCLLISIYEIFEPFALIVSSIFLISVKIIIKI